MASLGDTLRDRRLALGITLDQAASSLRIREALLAALEEGAYDKLPHPGYVRGYISSYARFLELDPQALLQLYRAETGLQATRALDLPQIEEAVPRTGEQHAITRRAAWTGVTVVALAALVVWGSVSLLSGSGDEGPAPVPVTGAGPARADGQPGEQDRAPAADAQPPSTRPAAPPFELTVRVADSSASWVRITIDGRRAYEGTLTGGQKKSFQVAREASVRIGKPSAVTLLRDGEPVPIPPSDNPTVRLTAKAP